MQRRIVFFRLQKYLLDKRQVDLIYDNYVLYTQNDFVQFLFGFVFSFSLSLLPFLVLAHWSS